MPTPTPLAFFRKFNLFGRIRTLSWVQQKICCAPYYKPIYFQNAASSAPGLCIDGFKAGPCEPNCFCHTDCTETSPWLALEFHETVDVTKVVLYNRDDNSYATRLKNVKVRVTQELPTSGDKMFTGGQLLGTFAGPGGQGQVIELENSVKTGKYVLVQMDARDCLHLREVEAYGPVETRPGKNYSGPSEWINFALDVKTSFCKFGHSMA